MTKEEVKHINWMYNRLISVHNENPNYDYMLKFKEIIDKQLNIVIVSDRKIVRCEDPMVCLRGCSVHEQTCKDPIYER